MKRQLPNGIFWLELAISPVKDESGVINAVKIITKDITLRKTMEEKIRENEERYRVIIENSNIHLYAMDMDLNFIYMSPNPERMTGYTEEESYKIPLAQQLTPRSLKILMKALRTELKIEQKPNKDIKRTRKFILEQIHKEGYTYFTEDVITFLRDENGKAIGILGLSKDITEALRMEELLKESEEQFRTISEQALTGIAIIQDDELKYVNDTYSKINGFTKEEIYNWPKNHYLDFVYLEDRKFVTEQAKKKQLRVEEGIVSQYFYRAYNKAKEILWIELDSKTIKYKGRDAILCSIKDITEQKEAEEAIKESEGKFRSLLENSPDLICMVDRQWIIQYINRTTSGIEAEKVIGKSIFTLIPSSEIERAKETFNQSLHNNKVIEIPSFVMKNNGNEVIFKIRFIPLKKGEEINSILIIATDITVQTKVQEEREKSKQLFQKVFQFSPNLMCVTQMKDGILIDGNEVFFNTLGIKREHSIGLPAKNFYKDQEDVKNLQKELKEKGKLVDKELKFLAKNNQIRIGLVSAEIIEFNNQPCLISSVVDITEKKEAEENLYRSEELRRQFMNSSIESFILLDSELNIIEINMAALKIFGLNKDKDVIGNSIEKIMPDTKNSGRYNKYRAVLKTGKPLFIEDHLIYKTRGEFYFSIIVFKVGEGLGIISRDITKRKIVEGRLKKSEKNYRVLVETSQELICRTDIKGNIEFANNPTYELLGYKREEFLSLNVFDIIHPNDYDLNKKMLKHLINGESLRNIEYRARTKSGSYLILSTSVSPILNSRGKIISILMVSRDITGKKLVEEQILEKEKRLRVLSDNSNDVILALDLNMNLTYISPSVTDMLGYSVDEMIFTRVIKYMTSSSQKVIKEAMIAEMKIEGKKDKDLKRSRKFEIQLIHKNGSIVYTEDTITFNRDDNGNPIGILGVARDISERKIAENILRENEEKLRVLSDNPSDFIISLDLKLNTTYVSKSIQRIIGYTPREIMNKSILDFLTESSLKQVMNIFSEEMELERSEIVDLMRSRHFNAEILHIRGNIVPVECVFTFSRDSAGKAIGLIGVAKDVSDKRKTEILLQNTLKRFNTVSENSNEALWAIDLDLKFTYISPTLEKIKGYTSDELKKLPLSKHIHPESFETFVNAFKEEMDIEKREDKDLKRSRVFETKQYRKDGSIIFLEDTITFERDEYGKAVGFLGISRDISDRRIMEEKLKESEEKYRLISENARDVIWTVDLDWKFTYVSPSVEDVLGYSVEEIFSLDLSKFVDSKSLEKLGKTYEYSLDNPEKRISVTYEIQHTHKNGQTIESEMTTNLLYKDEEVIGAIGISRDITERKKIERERERLNAILESTSDFVSFSSVNQEIIYVNSAGRKMVGWGIDEDLSGKSIKDAHPDYAFNKLNTVIIPKTIQEGIWMGENELINAKGEITPISQVIMAHKLPNGELDYLSTIIRDISEQKQAEMKIRESEQLFKDISYNIADWIWEVNREGRFTYVTGKVFENIGYQPEELIGKTPFDFMDEHEAKRVEKIFSKLLSEQKIIKDLENWNIAKDGRKLCFLTNGVPIYNEEMELIGYRGVDKNITNRKKSEEILKISEERLKLVLKMAQMGSYEYNIAENSVELSEEVCKLYEIDAQHYVCPVETVINELIHPDDRERIQDVLQRVIITGKNESTEFKIIGRKGTIKNIYSDANLLYDDIGNTIGIIGYMQNITEQKKIEQALIESESNLRSILTHSPDVITMVDQEGKILYLNRTITGRSVDDIIGKSVYEYTSQQYRGNLRKAIIDAFEKGQAEAISISGHGLNGRKVPYICRFGPIKKNGDIGAVLIISTSILEQKQAEEALGESGGILNAILENTPNFIVMLDNNGIVQFVNREFPGMDIKFPVGTSFFNLAPKESKDNLKKIIDDIFKNKSKGELNYSYLVKNETKIEINICYAPVISNWNVVAAILIITDLTDYKKIENNSKL
ncbi:MAG: PAS domain S-box protein [archaeon]|nr:PAS domain S-box protein [archaeon]